MTETLESLTVHWSTKPISSRAKIFRCHYSKTNYAHLQIHRFDYLYIISSWICFIAWATAHHSPIIKLTYYQPKQRERYISQTWHLVSGERPFTHAKSSISSKISPRAKTHKCTFITSNTTNNHKQKQRHAQIVLTHNIIPPLKKISFNERQKGCQG